jgi:hypothetical protein
VCHFVPKGNAIFFGTDKSMVANAGVIAFAVSIISVWPVIVIMILMNYLGYDRQLHFFYHSDTPGYLVSVVCLRD